MADEIAKVYQPPVEDKDLADTNTVTQGFEYDEYPPSGKDAAHIPANAYEVDPFSAQRADHEEDCVDFRSMGWVQAGLVATAENIALGALSYPSIFLRLGMVGGLIANVGLGVLAYITAWIMIDFKMKHMGVMHFADAGGLLFGPWGRRILGAGMVAKSIGLGGSHVLAGRQALNTLSTNAICSVWYALIIAFVSVMMSTNREFGKLAPLSWLSVSCILIACMITIVATGVQSSSVLVKHGVPIEWHATPTNPNLMDVIGALTNVVFAYGGNMGVFSWCSEMKNPNDFKKSFLITQGLGIIVYCIVGATIYAFGGQYVTSPAFTMTTKPVRITAYAFALVTILISGIVGLNVGAKYLYVNTFRKSRLLTSKGLRARLAWVGIVTVMWIAAFVLAELIPFFNQLLTIVSSLFSVWFSYGLCGVIWFYNKHPYYAHDGEIRSMTGFWPKFFMGCAILSIALSIAITPLGLYSAIQGIRDGYSAGTFTHPFSCS
ncbi:uncharacterized protein IL334_001398 [Kwoniella shivajii]|uniref:Amino acid transporter transmembrane domain-containing protein n=1 Tax=Kwoniella shivajii TaxID=564305 RepID=A0ABZ1CRU3_9TREE|nr:hypothetical protein IL334_001398 [Kwoniella shivajii]